MTTTYEAKVLDDLGRNDRVLAALRVLGGEADAETIATVAGLPRATAYRALAALRRDRLVRPSDRGRWRLGYLGALEAGLVLETK